MEFEHHKCVDAAGALQSTEKRAISLVLSMPGERQLLFVVADILKLGGGAKVLEPEEVLEQVRSEIQKMAENYQ